MDRNRVGINLAIGVLLTTASAVSAIAEPSPVDPSFDATSRKARNEVARNLLGRIQGFANSLPIQKREDSAWVKRESEAIQKLGEAEAARSRLTQLVGTPEFQQEKLQNTLAAIQDALSCTANPSTPLRREIMCWSVASFLLTDHATFHDSISVLIKADRLPKDITRNSMVGTESLGYGVLFEVIGRAIQERVVIRYLKGEIN